MNIYYFFQKYLDKKNEVEFKIAWERFVHSKIKRFMTLIVIVWFIGIFVFGYFMNIIIGFFFAFILTIFFSAYWGYILLIQSIKFLGINNTRYIQGRAEMDENIMNYEDVV